MLGASEEKKAALMRPKQLRQQGAIDAISEQLKQLAIRWIDEHELRGFYVEHLLSEVDRRLWNATGINRAARHGNADVLWKSIQAASSRSKNRRTGLISWSI